MVRQIGEPIPEDQLVQAEEDINKGYKTLKLKNFLGREEVTINIYHPNISEQAKIAMVYTTTFNNLLLNSELLTKKQMLDTIEKKGIWTEADEEKVSEMRMEMTAAEIAVLQELRNKKPNTKIIDLNRKKYSDVRDKILDKISVRETFLAQTIEAKAEEEANIEKMVNCIKYADGTPVWLDADTIKNSREPEVISLATEASYFWNGISREVLSWLPGVNTQGAILEQSQENQDGSEDTQSVPT